MEFIQNSMQFIQISLLQLLKYGNLILKQGQTYLSKGFSTHWQRYCLLTLTVILSSLFVFGTPSALASIDDDHYDGNIFALYAGNGSLVPPKVRLVESLKRKDVSLLFFYVDDSRDCKQASVVFSQLQAFYGRAANLIPVDIDAIPIQSSYTPSEAGYYYKGVVPQLVILDQQGKVVFDEKGQVPYEKVDDVLREVFDLLPRSESPELKRRSVNEFSTELSQ